MNEHINTRCWLRLACHIELLAAEFLLCGQKADEIRLCSQKSHMYHTCIYYSLVSREKSLFEPPNLSRNSILCVDIHHWKAIAT